MCPSRMKGVKSTSLFKNIVLTTILAGLVFWMGAESANRGIFKLKRAETPTESNAEPSAAAALPTPTPLPAHFPEVETEDLAVESGEIAPLPQAYTACWPESPAARPSALSMDANELTTTDVETLFGHVKKREVLEKTEEGTKLGLLFDTSVFNAGAAGSATEKNGAYIGLHLRAAGRMLHCESVQRCECL